MKKFILLSIVLFITAIELNANDLLIKITVYGRNNGTTIDEEYQNGVLIRRTIKIDCWNAIQEVCYTQELTGPNRILLTDGNENFIAEGVVISANLQENEFVLEN